MAQKYEIDHASPAFVQILNRILFDATLSMGARLTYAALVEHYRDNGSCWPSMARLGTMVGCCARTVQNHMKELITRGLVTVVKRGYWKRANEYRLHALVTPPAAQEGQAAPDRDRDMRNRGAGDMPNRDAAQVYQPNIGNSNSWKRRAKEAGAADFIRRELARRAAKGR